MFTVKARGEQRVIEFATSVDTGEAYDITQCYDEIHDGDVLVVSLEGVVGVMVSAWPTAVTAVHGEFHDLADGYTLDGIDDGKYALAAAVATEIAAEFGEEAA
jgi:hypothetical protein